MNAGNTSIATDYIWLEIDEINIYDGNFLKNIVTAHTLRTKFGNRIISIYKK